MDHTPPTVYKDGSLIRMEGGFTPGCEECAVLRTRVKAVEAERDAAVAEVSRLRSGIKRWAMYYDWTHPEWSARLRELLNEKEVPPCGR